MERRGQITCLMNRQQAIKNAVVALSLLLNGGEGSGNWGHLGRPAKRGGSGSGTVGVSSNNIRKILDSANKNGGMTIDIHGNTKREPLTKTVRQSLVQINSVQWS